MEEFYKGDFNKAVRDYLQASYSYYIVDEVTGFSDSHYDYLCNYLLMNFDIIRSPHKHLLCKGSLQCGTGYNIKEEDYPKELFLDGNSK